jgi:hypothetical protein
MTGQERSGGAAVFVGPTWLDFEGYGGSFRALAIGGRGLTFRGNHAVEVAATFTFPGGQSEALPLCAPEALDCEGRRSPGFVSTATVAFRPDIHLRGVHTTFGGGALAAGNMRGGPSWAITGVLGVEWSPGGRARALQLSMRVFVPHRPVAGMSQLFVPAIGLVF